MTDTSLAALGNGGAIRKARAENKRDLKDDRPVLDVSKPYDVGYCCFDEPFFNTADRTISIGGFFSAGDSFTEGIVTRMVMHPGGVVEVLLESQLVIGKKTIALLHNPKNCSPLALDLNGQPVTPQTLPVRQMYRSLLATPAEE